MSRCLRERTLWGIYEGEGTAAQQAHLQTCVACRVRYQALMHTLEEISSSLQATPPPPVRMPRPFPYPVRWQSAVVGLAVLLLLVGGSLWLRLMPPPTQSAVVYSEELTPLLGASAAAPPHMWKEQGQPARCVLSLWADRGSS